MKKIHKCENCNRYTLKEVCGLCGKKTKDFKSYKFIVNERYIIYRLKEKGYL